MSVWTEEARRERVLPAAGALLIGATVVAGLALKAGGHVELGTPLPPFLFSWSPAVRWPALLAAGVSLAAAGLAARLVEGVRSRAGFAAAIYGIALAVGLSVNAARRGVSGWTHVFDLSGHGSFEASREYLPALAQLRHGVPFYVGHFAALLPVLPTHVKGNPPGPGARHAPAGARHPRAPGRGLHRDRRAVRSARPRSRPRPGRGAARPRGRRAERLLARARPLRGDLDGLRLRRPGDGNGVAAHRAAAAARGSAAARWRRSAPLPRGCCWRSPRGRCSSSSWGTAGGRRRGLAAACAAAVIALNGGLALALGYDPVAVVRELGRLYGAGAAAHRPYAFWLLGSPVAWLVMLGIPVAAIALRALGRRDPAAVALAAVVACSAVAGFTKAETERIWLPFVPLACAAAAAVPIRRLRVVLVLLVVQALVVEVLFGTVW